MKLLSLTINSFTPLRFGPVTLPLDRQGLVLIEGENLDSLGWSGANRAGKSALFESIPWCWWGKMPRYGDRRLGDEPCHPIHGADVSVVHRITDDEVFRTRRVKMPGKSAKLTVEVATDDWPGATWRPVSGSALHAYEADMASLLGFTYETFRAALFLQAAGFTVTTAGFTSQLKLLESVLRFDTLTEAGDRAKARSVQADKSLAVAQTTFQSLQREIESGKQEIARLESLDESAERTRIADEIEGLTRRLTAFPVDLVAQVTEAERQAADARVVSRSAAVLSGKSDMAYQQARELAGQQACPTCAQSLKKSYTGPIVANAENHAKVHAANAKEAQQNEEALNEQVRELREQLTAKKDLERKLKNLDGALRAIDERQAALNSHHASVSERLAEKQVAAEAKEGEIEGLDWLAAVSKFWVKGFGSDGLKAEILGAGTPVLNAAAHRYSDILTDGVITVEFDPFRSSRVEDLIRIKIDGVPVKYETCSSSERRRVDIIVALSHRALARWRLARPVNVGLADELFDTLDDQGLQRVMAVIQQDVDELSTLFVVSHNAALKAMFPGAKVWTVVRKNNEAKVCVD